MIQRGENLGFALEASDAVGVGEKFLGEDLDGDAAPQLRVAGAVDFAHAARAERSDDFIGAEVGAGSEGHEEFRISRWR